MRYVPITIKLTTRNQSFDVYVHIEDITWLCGDTNFLFEC